MNIPLRILVFPLIYFGMAALVWYEIWRAFGTLWGACWAVFSVVTIAWAMVVRFVEFDTPAALALVGYLTLPFTGLTFLLLVVFELADFISGRAVTRNFSVQRVVIFVFIFVCALLLYGVFEARQIRINEIKIPTDKLPNGTDLIRVVQLSDLHIGKTFGKERLEEVMDLVRQASPDLVVITGDIVDDDLSKRDDMAELLGSVNAPLGKFAVTGNHEHYSGFERSLEFIRKSGYEILRMMSRDIGPLVVTGVDDKGRLSPDGADSRALLQSMGKHDKFTIFLQHQPYVHENTVGYFDLQLSGHTHGGQIFPVGFITRLMHGYPQGLSAIREAEDTFLYISNGTGFWGPPIRIFSPPEITVLNIEKVPKRD